MIKRMIEASQNNDVNEVEQIEIELLAMNIKEAKDILLEFKEQANTNNEYYNFAKLTPKKEIFWKIVDSQKYN